jgi:hypothetical protein
MFYNRDIDVEIGRSPEGAMDLMRRALVRLFEDYPEVNGVIFRIGECDGVDVEGDFRSRLVLKNAAMVNDFISGTLPIFEERDRLMIMRTWTMGATRAGDLIWTSGTFDRAFRDVESENFIVSM